jgi:hypothetical protein
MIVTLLIASLAVIFRIMRQAARKRTKTYAGNDQVISLPFNSR